MNQPQQQTPPEAWTERTRLLFGDERVSELAQCHVLTSVSAVSVALLPSSSPAQASVV